MTKLKGAALALALGLALPFQAQATLIGDTVTIGGTFTASPPAATVGAGAESTLSVNAGFLLNLLSVDVDAYSVTWTSLITLEIGDLNGPTLLTLGDLDFAGFPGGIVGVDFAVAGVTGVDAADITFTTDSLGVDIQNTAWAPGNTLTVTFRVDQVAPVPEPGTLSLAALAAAGLWVSRRRSVVPTPQA